MGMNDPDRRQFLARSAAMALAPWGINLGSWQDAAAASAGDDYKALVCLYQMGGNDQDNTVVPYDSASHARYAAVRGVGAGQIGIDRAALAGTVLSPVLTAGRQYALHPQMTGMARLFGAGKAAILLNVGPLVVPLTREQYRSGGSRYPVPPKLFSHSDQAAVVQTAAGQGGGGTGHGARLLSGTTPANAHPLLSAISVDSRTEGLLSGLGYAPYQMTPSGALPISPIAVERGPAPSMVAALLQQARSHRLQEAYARIVRQSMSAYATVSTALGDYRAPTGVPRLTAQLRLVARMVAVHAALGMKRQVFYIAQANYDTHGGQNGQHPSLLKDLSDAVADFQAALATGGLEDRVTLFTSSEFGRTLTSNGDGTDHGWGGHHFIVGGAVKGGAFYGTPPPVSAGNTSAAEDQWHVGQGRLLPSTSVAQFMATLARWFGVPPDKLADVVPDIGNFGAAAGRPDYPVDLGFMR